MADTVLSMMRNIYDLNQKRSFRLSWKSTYLDRLYSIAKAVVNNTSKFFVDLDRLHNFNQRTAIFISKNNNYIAHLMNECKKECDPKEVTVAVVEPEVKENTVQVSKENKKAALLIGINYKGSRHQLNGCENDVIAVKEMLVTKMGFDEKNIMVLTESEQASNLKPTRNNILRAIDWLVQKGDEGFGSLWFHYSGHGSYFRDRNGDERDGYDECVVCSDMRFITDDEFRLRLVNRVRADSKLFCLMDCCHSGTMLDLRYKYLPGSNRMYAENRVQTNSNVISISGCRDRQTSADAEFSKDNWAGALSKYFVGFMEEHNYKPVLTELVKDLDKKLKEYQFTQTPQLTSSKELNPDTKLDM